MSTENHPKILFLILFWTFLTHNTNEMMTCHNELIANLIEFFWGRRPNMENNYGNTTQCNVPEIPVFGKLLLSRIVQMVRFQKIIYRNCVTRSVPESLSQCRCSHKPLRAVSAQRAPSSQNAQTQPTMARLHLSGALGGLWLVTSNLHLACRFQGLGLGLKVVFQGGQRRRAWGPTNLSTKTFWWKKERQIREILDLIILLGWLLGGECGRGGRWLRSDVSKLRLCYRTGVLLQDVWLPLGGGVHSLRVLQGRGCGLFLRGESKIGHCPIRTPPYLMIRDLLT